MMGGLILAGNATKASGPYSAVHANRAINSLPIHAAEHHLLSMVQAVTNYLACLKSVLANGHSLKKTTSNPLCLPEILISKHTPL